MKTIIVSVLCMTTMSISAQTVDLNADALEGLDLDYLGTAPDGGEVKVYSDLTYWNLFSMRQKGWNGGVGATSISMPDGNVFWAFGESQFGRISEFRNRTKNNNTVHNAAMVQTGEASERDFVTLNGYISVTPQKSSVYYTGKTWLRHPDASYSEQYIDAGLIDRDHLYYPLDGTVLQSSSGCVLQLMVRGYDADGNVTDNSVARFAVNGETPADGYLTLLGIDRDVIPAGQPYGVTLLEDGGHIYLYGEVSTGKTFGGTWPVVARTSTRDLTSVWEYYVNDEQGVGNWQTVPPTIEELQRSSITTSNIVGRAVHPSVFSYGGKYYMCMQNTADGSICISQSETPYGPFASRKVLYTIPQEMRTASRVTVHPQLSRMGELVLSYNMDPADITVYVKGDDGSGEEKTLTGTARKTNAWGSANLNQTHFLRFFNWQSMFGVENAGPIQDAGLEWTETGIDTVTDNSGWNAFHVYPRTVSTTFCIDAETTADYSWQLLSSSGTVVRQGKACGNCIIEVEGLPKGIYVVRVGSGNALTIEKLLKN
ncbi:MAG: DUF5005 domain-containing protein [Prevotella sp.]